MDKPGLPLDVVVLLVLVLPCCLAVFFGFATWRKMTPLAFRCARCDHEFRREAWKRFPKRCPSCRAEDWNLPNASKR